MTCCHRFPAIAKAQLIQYVALLQTCMTDQHGTQPQTAHNTIHLPSLPYQTTALEKQMSRQTFAAPNHCRRQIAKSQLQATS
jgi:hypothetical protein